MPAQHGVGDLPALWVLRALPRHPLPRLPSRRPRLPHSPAGRHAAQQQDRIRGVYHRRERQGGAEAERSAARCVAACILQGAQTAHAS